MNSSIPSYPGKTFISLKKKRWYDVSRDIIRREKITHAEILLEPEWYYWKASFVERVIFFFRLRRRPQILGTTTTELNTITDAVVGHTIQVSVGSSRDEIMDTILHEIAHALTPLDSHGPLWKEEYLRLRKKYKLDSRVRSDNDRGERVEV